MRKMKMEKSDRNFIYAVVTTFFVAVGAARYAHADFARNGIISPDIWIATFIVALFVYAFAHVICMSIYLLRFT